MNEDPKVRIVNLNQTLSTENADFIRKETTSGNYPRIFDLFKICSEEEAKNIEKGNKIKQNILDWLNEARIEKPPEPIPQDKKGGVIGFDSSRKEVRTTLLSHQGEYSEPFRGFPAGDAVNRMSIFKKLLQTATRHNKGLFFKIGMFILYKSGIFKRLVFIWIDFTHIHLRPYLIKPVYYTEPVKEVYRTLTEIQGKVKGIPEDMMEEIKDVFCMLLEYDNAYRYRFQDIIIELNLEALKRNPYKETKKLFEIMAMREVVNPELGMSDHMRVKIRKLGQMVSLLVRFDKSLKSLLRNVADVVDLDRIKPSKEDIYWFSFRDDYNFLGVPIEKRMKWKTQMYPEDKNLT